METDYQHTIVTLVERGLGVALVHRYMKTIQPQNVKFRNLVNAPFEEVNATWTGKNRNPCTTTCVKFANPIGSNMHPGQDS